VRDHTLELVTSRFCEISQCFNWQYPRLGKFKIKNVDQILSFSIPTHVFDAVKGTEANTVQDGSRVEESEPDSYHRAEDHDWAVMMIAAED